MDYWVWEVNRIIYGEIVLSLFNRRGRRGFEERRVSSLCVLRVLEHASAGGRLKFSSADGSATHPTSRKL